MSKATPSRNYPTVNPSWETLEVRLWRCRSRRFALAIGFFLGNVFAVLVTTIALAVTS